MLSHDSGLANQSTAPLVHRRSGRTGATAGCLRTRPRQEEAQAREGEGASEHDREREKERARGRNRRPWGHLNLWIYGPLEILHLPSEVLLTKTYIFLWVP